MNRALAMLAATACAALAISSACFAGDWTTLPFQLAKTKDAGRVQFSIHQRHSGQRPGPGSRTLALQVPGRFDCAGSVQSFDGHGHCAFAAVAAPDRHRGA